MTQPSLNQSFDTSLIDISSSKIQAQGSFSSTESAPSIDYKQTQTVASTAIPPLPKSVSVSQYHQRQHQWPYPRLQEAATSTGKMRTRYVPTVEAYNAWAEVYDSDGNMLQAVDDHELGQGGLMQQFATEVQKANPPSMTLEGRKRLDLVDFGCGTGRNTVTLLQQDWPSDVGVDVAGIDASIGMLRVADNKVAAALSDLGPARGFERTFRLVQHDFLDPIDPKRAPILLPRVHDVKNVYSIAPTGSFIAPKGSFAVPAGGFHGLITTLVLEHFPLQAFFAVLASLVRAGGIALVTNMHADMGSQSQAGFVTRDEEGEAIKMRGTSWAHGTGETIDAAISAGFEVVGEIRETAISEDMVKGGVVGVRGRKWIGVNVWYGMLLKKTS